jgi:hypothetical protein
MFEQVVKGLSHLERYRTGAFAEERELYLTHLYLSFGAGDRAGAMPFGLLAGQRQIISNAKSGFRRLAAVRNGAAQSMRGVSMLRR